MTQDYHPRKEDLFRLLAALRAKAALTGDTIQADQVEALTVAIGLSADRLPALVADLAKLQPAPVELIWGGVLKVLPDTRPSGADGSIQLNFPGAHFGPGAVIAGHDANVGTVIITPEVEAAGKLAAVVVQLRAELLNLTGDAAKAATSAVETLSKPPAPTASGDSKVAWRTRAVDMLKDLLKAAPAVGELVKLGVEAVKFFVL